MTFEHTAIFKAEDNLMSQIHEQPTSLKIAAVRKIDHIIAPNINFDYKLFCILQPTDQA